MRPCRALAVYVAVIFLGGALLAPLLHGLAATLAERIPSLQNLAGQPFSRYLTRCFMALALLGLWPFMRALGAQSLADIGLVRMTGQGRNLLAGFLVGFASLAVILVVALLAGARTWDLERSPAQISRHLFNATLSAVVVGILEEIVFRGGIFGGFRRMRGFKFAVVASSAVFAILHFFAPVKLAGPVHWYSGLDALGRMCGGFLELQSLVPGFLNLALAGAILALVYHRTGALYAAIGLHAGWIFWIKTGGFFTRLSTDANPWLWGTNKLVDGWLAVPILIATLLVVARCFPARPASASA